MDNELFFNSEIYPAACISYSAKQYDKIAAINISSDGMYIKCRFDNCVYDLSETMNEFDNFVIEALFSKVYENDTD